MGRRAQITLEHVGTGCGLGTDPAYPYMLHISFVVTGGPAGTAGRAAEVQLTPDDAERLAVDLNGYAAHARREAELYRARIATGALRGMDTGLADDQ